MKLSELIDRLTEIYDQNGDMNAVIIRNGTIYKKIETYIGNDYNYNELIVLEAFKTNEW